MNTQITKKEKDQSLSIIKTYDLGKPAEVVAMATVLKNYVVQQKLYANIKGKNYAMIEGWQFAGFLTGLNVIVDEPKNLSNGTEIKWSATARIYQGEKVVGIGYALCSSKEVSKKGFDEYAILSMSQTRAIGKAYRNKMGWVMKLAGFAPTPSEEMHKVGETVHEPIITPNEPINDSGKPQPLKKGQVDLDGHAVYLCEKCDAPIDEIVANYSQKMYGKRLCREDQKTAKRK